MKRKQIIKRCEIKLLELKHDIGKRLKDQTSLYREGLVFTKLKDQDKNTSFLLKLLPEVLFALDRIKDGTYGICQKTGSEIDNIKLLSTPWTRTT